MENGLGDIYISQMKRMAHISLNGLGQAVAKKLPAPT